MSQDRPTPTEPAAPDLRILEERVYRGGNIWSYDPAIHLVVDLGVLEAYPTDTLPGFTDGLLELVPGLANHSCSRGREGGFVERLREGTWLGMSPSMSPCSCNRRPVTTSAAARPGWSRVAQASTTSSTATPTKAWGYRPGRLAVRLINHLIAPEEEFDFAEEFEYFLRRAERTGFGPSTQPRSSRRRSAGTSPTSDSTPPHWCNSVRACTRSGSAPR
jgi:cyanophycin synthetase